MYGVSDDIGNCELMGTTVNNPLHTRACPLGVLCYKQTQRILGFEGEGISERLSRLTETWGRK